MAHIYRQSENDHWNAFDLTGNECPLSEAGLLTSDATGEREAPVGGCESLVCSGPEGDDSWFLVVPIGAHVSVNGSRVMLGIRAIEDRDEIFVRPATPGAAIRFFFSTERRVEVVPFPGANQPISCPRCKQSIAAGELAVRCPNPACGLWHHATDELPCWSYSSTCASPACGQPTELTDYRWTPEGL